MKRRQRLFRILAFCIVAAWLGTSCGSDDPIGLDSVCPLGTVAPLFDKIAFEADGNIYVMNADGTGQIDLTSTSRSNSDRDPTWSPDGTMMAFTTTRRDRPWDVYVMNADGTCPTLLVDSVTRTSLAAWSPDGMNIAYQMLGDGDWEVHVINANGTGATRLTRNAREPAWSPDGTKIAFSTDRDFPSDPFDFDPEEEYAAIYVINADGTDPTRLTHNMAFDGRSAWSPDGTKIAFHSDRDGTFGIYVMNPDGTGLTRLNNGVSPAWSPDGTKVAFGSFGEIYVMNADGTGQINLTNNFTFHAYNPSWSPSR